MKKLFNCELPKVLNNSETNKLFKEFELGNKEARDILISNNIRLVIYIAKKLIRNNDELEDIVGIGTIGLIKGIDSFKLEKNIKLYTYITHCISNEINMYYRKKRINNTNSLYEKISINSDNDLSLIDIIPNNNANQIDKLIDNDEYEYILSIIETLSKEEQKFISLYYGLNGEETIKQWELAKTFGISQPYVSRRLNKILEKIKKKMIKEKTLIKRL